MDFAAAVQHLKQDKLLAEVIKNTPVEFHAPTRNIYYDLLESIVSQQLSVKAATTIFTRFCTLFPDSYPLPDLVLNTPVQQLRDVGVSAQKAGYLKNIAVFAQENDLEQVNWESLSDLEIIHFLTQIKGIGRWTSEMILMFSLGRPDVFPADDLGIQQAIVRLYGLVETKQALRQRMFEIAEPWRPYRTIACRYLWRWKDQVKNSTV